MRGVRFCAGISTPTRRSWCQFIAKSMPCEAAPASEGFVLYLALPIPARQRTVHARSRIILISIDGSGPLRGAEEFKLHTALQLGVASITLLCPAGPVRNWFALTIGSGPDLMETCRAEAGVSSSLNYKPVASIRRGIPSVYAVESAGHAMASLAMACLWLKTLVSLQNQPT